MTNDELLEAGIAFVKAEYQLEKSYGLDIHLDEIFRHAYKYVSKHLQEDKSAEEKLMEIYEKNKRGSL